MDAPSNTPFDPDRYLLDQIAENDRHTAELEQIKANAYRRPPYTKAPFDADEYLAWSIEQERLEAAAPLTIDDLIPPACLEPAPIEPESTPKPMTDDELAETFGPEGYALLTRATDEQMLKQIERCWREDVPSWRKSRIEAEQSTFLKSWEVNPGVASH
jgi:hypothetical protein